MSVHNFYKEPMLPEDVYIGRAGKGMDGYFGNPFILLRGEERGSTLDKFEEYARDRIANDPEYKERVKGLYGKRLFCFCKPNSCHGDVLERLAAEMVDNGATYGYPDKGEDQGETEIPDNTVYCPECGDVCKRKVEDQIVSWKCRCGWSEIEDIMEAFAVKIGYGSVNDPVHLVTFEDLIGATLVFQAKNYGEDPEHCKVLAVENERIITTLRDFDQYKIQDGLRDRRILIPMRWGAEGEAIPF